MTIKPINTQHMLSLMCLTRRVVRKIHLCQSTGRVAQLEAKVCARSTG